LPIAQFTMFSAVKLSGTQALTDQDIARLLLSPIGVAGLIMAGSVLIVIAVLELALMLWVIQADTKGQHINLVAALRAIASRLPRLLGYAARLIMRLATVILPFAALAGLVAWTLLTEFDINYYLAFHPPEFIRAVLIIAPIILCLLCVLLYLFTGWALAFQLALFTDTPLSGIFAESVARSQGLRKYILGRFVLWGVLSFLITVSIAVALRFIIVTIMPDVSASLPIVAVTGGVLLVIWSATMILVSAFNTGTLAIILSNIAKRADIPFSDRAPAPVASNLRWLALTLAGFFLASSIGSATALYHGAGTPDQVAVIAHRGAAGKRPENTMAAMEAAIKDGADWLEIDVQETADGEVIVIHDSDFMKIAGNPAKVWETTAAALANIDVGTWFDPAYSAERVPTLKQVLLAARGRARVLIELKYYGHDVDLAGRVAAIVEATDMVADTAFMSLNRNQMARMKAIRPNWRVGLLAATAIGDLSKVEADFLAVSTASASAGFIARARKAGKDVYVWTVNDPLAMSRMMSRGAVGLITDEPAMAVETIAARRDTPLVGRLMLEAADLIGLDVKQKIYRDDSP
ncbi:MAG: glycerophosphodiester phosphodiesterase, partial [Proteobacteria bacterium]|nr:glycerophosphodiester phosphodiesterase [Pseudomonadota bacterium]